MFFDQDLRRFGKLDRLLTEPLRQAVKNIDFSSSRFIRKEGPLSEGKLIEFPFMIQVYTENSKGFEHLLDLAQPIVDHVKQVFPEYVFMRGEISAILPGTQIKQHVDRKWFHANCHRMHVPIITNDQCHHYFEDRSLHLDEDELVEINNRIFHSADNLGTQTRVHCIFDIISKENFDKAIQEKIKFNDVEAWNY